MKRSYILYKLLSNSIFGELISLYLQSFHDQINILFSNKNKSKSTYKLMNMIMVGRVNYETHNAYRFIPLVKGYCKRVKILRSQGLVYEITHRIWILWGWTNALGIKVQDIPTFLFRPEAGVVHTADQEYSYILPRNCGFSGKIKFHWKPPSMKGAKRQS